jgi:hypothetical protein
MSIWRLDSGSAAVNESFDARDEAVIRRQKQHHFGPSSGESLEAILALLSR